MVSKKYALILGLIGLIQTASFAQKSDASDSWVFDSSKVSTKNMPQHSEFMNNQYPYPSKPRSMWELGFGGGMAQIYGDVLQRFGYGGSVSVRKALGHVVSLRAAYFGSINYGIDNKFRIKEPSTTQGHADPWAAYLVAGPLNGGGYSTNYRAKVHQIALDAIVSLNALSHYRGNPKTDWYLLAGYSIQGSDVDVNARNEGGSVTGGLYSFAGIDYTQKSSKIQSDIKALEDKTYESDAPVGPNQGRLFIGHSGEWYVMHGFNFGGGVAFRLTDRVNLGIEQRFTASGNDNLDGVVDGRTNDIQSNTQARININIGSASKHVLPLWWLNPNNYVYNEINKPTHMKFPPVILPDADGDGVTDQFDMEPNTPAGCPVDSHGVSRDTDGDGVPDCRDKELLTPQNCFPVDADGIGKCPCPPASCFPVQPMVMPTCSIGMLPSVQFKSGSTSLGSTAMSILASIAQQMNANPTCNVRVTGHGPSDKRGQQLSWDRVNSIIKYLVEKQGISESRFIFTYGTPGDVNTVDLMGTGETGPNTVPAPHPQFQKSN